MKGLLADINLVGQATQLVIEHLRSNRWQEVWLGLNLTVFTFADVGLAARASDADVWQLCQLQELVLLTGNRNQDGPDSLEATIRTHNTPTCLPVFTVADSEQMRRSPAYRERIAIRLLEYLQDIEQLRGTGRLFLP